MLSDLMVHDVTVERLSVTGNKQAYGAPTTIKGFLQALDTEDALQADGIFVLSYKLYVEENTDVKEGDRVTVEGVVYNVKSCVRYTMPESDMSHKRLILVEVKNG
jgi:hypothetical protein